MIFRALLVLSSLLLIACQEDKSILNYAKARACLDQAVPATAKACTEVLAGDDSMRANKIRCAAEFIAQGLTNDQLANIFSEIKESDSNSFTFVMTELTFKGSSTAEALELSNNAFVNCNKSGSSGMILFASLARSATVLAQYDGGWDGTNTPNIIGVGNTSSDEELGEVVLAMNQAYCSSGSGADSDVCNQISDIIGSNTDPTDIGSALRNYLN